MYVLHDTITCIDTKVKQKKPTDAVCDMEGDTLQVEIKNTSFIGCDYDGNKDNAEDSIEDLKPASKKKEPKVKQDKTKRQRIDQMPLKKSDAVPNSTDEIIIKENFGKSVLESNEDAQFRENPKLSMSRKRKRKPPQNESFFKCEHKGCDKLIKSRNKKQHLATHKNERFECDICHASLASKTGLRAHFYLHYPIKELKCHICGAEFRSPSSLNQHLRFIHYNEPKKFICNICGRSLRKNHLLKEHMNKHIGKKPFACTHDGCEKRFYSKAHRSEHMRSHTGEKPFKCTIEGCDRQFAYAIDFKRHKFKAHGIYTNKYNCPICLEIFPENMFLKKHMKTHHKQV